MAGTGRADPAVVAGAYATGLYTVEWTAPLPAAQKVAATRPWATPAATAKLAHGENYQPGRTDPRVAAGQRDTVERLDIEPGDPEPNGVTYVITVHLTTTTAAGQTTGQAVLVLHLSRTDGQWLVDDTRLLT